MDDARSLAEESQPDDGTPSAAADLGDLVGALSAAVTELAGLPSESRDVLITGLRDFCAPVFAHLNENRPAAEPERARVLAWNALHTAGLLADLLHSAPPEAFARAEPAPAEEAWAEPEADVVSGPGSVPATGADASPSVPAGPPDVVPEAVGPAPGTEPHRPDTPTEPQRPPLVLDHAEGLRTALTERFLALLDHENTKPWLQAPTPQLKPKGWIPGRTPTTVKEIWRAAHLALLHLPAEQCTHWRGELWRTALAAADDDLRLAHRWPERPPEDPTVIIPALPGHCPEQRLALRPDTEGELPASLPQELTAAVSSPEWENRHERWRVWAVRAGQVLRLTELDRGLVLRWKGTVWGPVDPEYLTKLLVERLTRLMKDGALPREAPGRFRAEYDLDALIGSVLRPTVAALDSWWWSWRTALWDDLASAAPTGGYEFVKDVTFMDRDEVLRFTGGDNLPGRPGLAVPLVQWVLHALARGPDAEEKGLGVVVLRQQNLSGRTS